MRTYHQPKRAQGRTEKSMLGKFGGHCAGVHLDKFLSVQILYRASLVCFYSWELFLLL